MSIKLTPTFWQGFWSALDLAGHHAHSLPKIPERGPRMPSLEESLRGDAARLNKDFERALAKQELKRLKTAG